MIILLAIVIISYSFGVYWLSGKYLSSFKVDITSVKFRIIRAVVAFAVAALSSIFHIVLLVMLHLLVLFALGEFFKVIFRKIFKKYNGAKSYVWASKIYKSGVVPVLIVALLFTYGFFNMNTIRQTEYTVTSDKLQNSYRVVFISDTHFGTVHDAKTLQEATENINKLNPDIVILGGDIVEEGTEKTEMAEAFETLGKINSTYGIYFVYGNHDRQRYTSVPEYSEEELADTITKNGIMILKEDYIEIGDDILLVGREDLSAKKDRVESNLLLNGADTDRFILVADHQPNNVKSNTSYGADLQLSGHTHGGQMMPLGWMPFLYSGYVYGEYKTDNTAVIVSSGFAGWGFPIRTQAVSEYVVIDICNE
ncbi:MAG: metallophosphoesterase [Clostridia bacterium]|nr:metallophosphoesterase [Clostridia bacterium]